MKSTAYISVIRPMLEYAISVSFGIHTYKYIYLIDQVQSRAARWVLSRYSSVTSMQQEL